MLNPHLSKKYLLILAADMITQQHQQQLESVARNLGVSAIITDVPIEFATSFNFTTKERVLVEDHIFLYNDHSINEHDIDPGHKHIYITNKEDKNKKCDLKILLGDNFKNYPITHGEWYKSEGDIYKFYTGGQPTDILCWCLFMFNKETLELEWGLHNMEWSFYTGEKEGIKSPFKMCKQV